LTVNPYFEKNHNKKFLSGTNKKEIEVWKRLMSFGAEWSAEGHIGSEWGEVTGEWRKVHIEELTDVHTPTKFI
jgi:hypothetical protein